MNKLTLIALLGLVCVATAALPSNCKTGEVTDAGPPIVYSDTVCGVCEDGYALTDDGASCTPCTAASNCLTCQTGVAVCDTCKTGYGLQTGNKCEKCTAPNCDNCPTDVAVCSSCSTGYANTRSDGEETSGDCEACENGCKDCATIDASCSSCPTGQEKNNTDTKNVFCCAVNCSTCSTTSACLTCKDGSSLNDKNACVFGFKTSATLTLGAVVSIAILSLLF